ncbi:glycosyltransferase family 32 protein [Podospora didyma]|uniref:Glycosyltransferase family 32 protein n=1 Tax=Podospora didyma TaxID=330526 RepID=A0AAE0N6Q0_9PEZI|nr:glycosyltransferase family 32 protein [Podospora didyma]
MHQHDGAGPSLPAQVLHHLTMRRPSRFAVTCMAAFFFLAAVWLYGETAMDSFGTTRERLPPAPLPTTVSLGSGGSKIPTTGDHTKVPATAGNKDTPKVDATKDTPKTEDIKVAPTPAGETKAEKDKSKEAGKEKGTEKAKPAAAPLDWPKTDIPPGDISHPGHISPKIWQILLQKNPSAKKVYPDPKSLQDTASWLAMNADYKYTLVSDQGGKDFVERRFAHEPRIVDAYNHMPNVGMKSDLLRYLLLDAEGGVYTDTDTVAIRPIEDWIPKGIERDKVKLIVGIEFDRRDGGAWADISHWLQFCQWTIAAAPGHPVFRKMTERILTSLDDIAHAHNLPIDQVKPTSFEVMNSTGPAAWTDAVFEQLQLHDSTLTSTKDLSFMEEPRLYGDILVLTIDGFGMGQAHSASTNDGTTPKAALVKHLFRGSWRGE